MERVVARAKTHTYFSPDRKGTHLKATGCWGRRKKRLSKCRTPKPAVERYFSRTLDWFVKSRDRGADALRALEKKKSSERGKTPAGEKKKKKDAGSLDDSCSESFAQAATSEILRVGSQLSRQIEQVLAPDEAPNDPSPGLSGAAATE